jgi:hypothetical protein
MQSRNEWKVRLTIAPHATMIPPQSYTGFYQRSGTVTVSTFCRMVSLSALIIAMGTVTPANAATMYNVTVLGEVPLGGYTISQYPAGTVFQYANGTVAAFEGGYTLNQNSSGAVTSVTNSSGTMSYAFDKSPVTYNPEWTSSNGLTLAFSDGISRFTPTGGGPAISTLNIASNGSGFISIEGFTEQEDHATSAVFRPWTPQGQLNSLENSNWYTRMSIGGGYPFSRDQVTSPVNDMNSSGQVVGVVNGVNAGFSDKDFQSHVQGTSIGLNEADNLNNYISNSLGINLTVGLKIDDLGRIIAQGDMYSNTYDFLLTPIGLSDSPLATPEPSAFAVLAVGITALGIRTMHLRRRQLRATA